MGDRLWALMGQVVAAQVELLDRDRVRLTYQDDYLSSDGATPLSLSLPLDIATHEDAPDRSPVSAFLQGLLPDNEEVIARWASLYQARSTRPFDVLGTPVGHDCAGAVSFCRPEVLDDYLARPGGVTAMSEADVAADLRAVVRDRSAMLGRDFSGEFSLAGAQAKIALRYDPGTGQWGRPHGTEATNRILKPSATGWSDQDLNEHLCLASARTAGLAAARSEVRFFEDQAAIVLHRYDRRAAGTSLLRVHQEDALQALGKPPRLKYQKDGGPSPKDLADLFRDTMTRREADISVRSFADAMIWNWIVAGTDAHAKNYSILLSGGGAVLAPLYDVSSFLPYIGDASVTGIPLRESHIKSAMKIGGDYALFPVARDRGRWQERWSSAADDLGLEREWLVDRIRELARKAPAAFEESAADPAVLARGGDLAQRLHRSVARRAGKCLEVFDARSTRATRAANSIDPPM